MKYSEARQGRIFVLRLEDGEIVHQVVESFARDRDIKAAALFAVGGADTGSTLVVGPKDGQERPVTPMERMLGDVHEIAGVGTLFPDEAGRPMLHMHMACGREQRTTTGCIRSGVATWQVMEIVIIELLDTPARRLMEPGLGFKLLDPEPERL
ncbi:MAG: PPC domain-containing DNA-binding protein [Thermodesulfobacteriota bacterium]